MSVEHPPDTGWFSRHRRSLGWVALLLVTGWLPLGWAAWTWWEHRDEVQPTVRPYEAEPARKLDDLLAGKGPPLVFAHRGDHIFVGQNSLEAFDRAVKRGYDGIELDVVNTAHDVPVVAHDLWLGDERLFVPEASLQEVRAHAESLPPEHFAKYHTLSDVLGQFGGQILFVVELKATEKSSFGVEEPACRVIKERGAADTVILSSLTFHVIETIGKTEACDGIARMYEVSGGGGDPPAPYELPLLGLRHDFLPERKSRYSDAVRAFSVYTPNHTFHIERAMREGALLIQTDRPGRAARIRAEKFGW